MFQQLQTSEQFFCTVSDNWAWQSKSEHVTQITNLTIHTQNILKYLVFGTVAIFGVQLLEKILIKFLYRVNIFTHFPKLRFLFCNFYSYLYIAKDIQTDLIHFACHHSNTIKNEKIVPVK